MTRTNNKFIAATLLAMTLTACGSEPEAPAPEPNTTHTPVVEAMALPVAKPVPEPCYSAPTLAHAMKLAADTKIKTLYSHNVRAETEIVRANYCTVTESGYADLGFDSEFASFFRDTAFGKAINREAGKVGVSDLELASAFYDIAG